MVKKSLHQHAYGHTKSWQLWLEDVNREHSVRSNGGGGGGGGGRGGEGEEEEEEDEKDE